MYIIYIYICIFVFHKDIEFIHAVFMAQPSLTSELVFLDDVSIKAVGFKEATRTAGDSQLD